MNIQDLTDNSRRILTALSQTPAACREIADLCQLGVMKVSRDLNRLEGFGFVEKPSEFGGQWRISEAGRRLFGDPVPMIAATAPAGPVPQSQEPDPDPDPVHGEPEPIVATESAPDPQPSCVQLLEPPQDFVIKPISEILLENQELNAAMDEVVARLGQYRISSTALRTYRRLIDALPPSVQRALSPITKLVEAQP